MEPNGNFDRNAWAAKLAMLADDMAGMPYGLLDAACSQHEANSPYLPKASDLRTIAKSMLREPPPVRTPSAANNGAQLAMEKWLADLETGRLALQRIDDVPDQWRRIAGERCLLFVSDNGRQWALRGDIPTGGRHPTPEWVLNPVRIDMTAA